MTAKTTDTQADRDRRHMQAALRLAVRGQGSTSPNPLVGAVVVNDGEIVGQGYHERAGGPHAEVNALAAAGRNAQGGTLYVTLEPCNHFGKTPPCTEAVIGAGIARVVVGMDDPNPHVSGGGADRLRKAGIAVLSGVLAAECRAINQPFIKYVTTGLPHVTLKAAATLDGFIASATGDSKWISNERSRQFVHRLRSALDAILVGIDTAVADDPQLTARLPGKKSGRQPVRIVLDTRLKISVESTLVRTARKVPFWIACGEGASRAKEALLVASGAAVLRLPSDERGIDLRSLLEALGRRQVTSVLVEGGARVLGGFMESGLADAFYFFYAPKILGDREGVPLVSGRSRQRIADAVPVFGVKTGRFGEDILVSGRFREQLY